MGAAVKDAGKQETETSSSEEGGVELMPPASHRASSGFGGRMEVCCILDKKILAHKREVISPGMSHHLWPHSAISRPPFPSSSLLAQVFTQPQDEPKWRTGPS